MSKPQGALTPPPPCYHTATAGTSHSREQAVIRISIPLLLILPTLGSFTLAAATVNAATPGAAVVEYFGYADCIELKNDVTKVVLCPAAGGRVLEYAHRGTNALYLDTDEEGWVTGSEKQPIMSAGRFDIGPEHKIPTRPELWSGRWRGEITGPRAARLTSVRDKPTGVQLIRDFKLDPKTTRLDCTQTIRNVSSETKEWCHWSRTFALGGGVCVIPLTKPSRFPNGYVMYEGGGIMIAPEDPHIRQRDGFLEIFDVPKFPKLGMDSYAGWFAYLMDNDLMFVKRFPTFPDRVYNEVAGLTISIWYPEDRRVELEPIGPRERIEPGESAAFTETWWLVPFDFPADREVDLKRLEQTVEAQTRK
jgi:hypothetical protein